MSRGKIIALIALVGLLILIISLYYGCRSGSYPLQPEEFEDNTSMRGEYPDRRYAHFQLEECVAWPDWGVVCESLEFSA